MHLPSGGHRRHDVAVRELTIVIADALRLLAESLATALRSWPGLNPVRDYPLCGTEALAAVRNHHPDVVLLDYWLPDMGGPALTKAILRAEPATKVLLVSSMHGLQDVRVALESGAVGFLPKSFGVDRIAEAIGRAHAGESPVYERELRELISRLRLAQEGEAEARRRLATLSPREASVLRLVASGHSTEATAAQLSIRPSTVKGHVHNALRKLGARTKDEALAMVRLCGWTGAGPSGAVWS